VGGFSIRGVRNPVEPDLDFGSQSVPDLNRDTIGDFSNGSLNGANWFFGQTWGGKENETQESYREKSS
jgi:hypothetical protein